MAGLVGAMVAVPVGVWVEVGGTVGVNVAVMVGGHVEVSGTAAVGVLVGSTCEVGENTGCPEP